MFHLAGTPAQNEELTTNQKNYNAHHSCLFIFLILATMETEYLLTIIAGCFALLGIVLTLIGIMWWQNIRHFVQTVEKTEGTVIELVQHLGKHSPIVEYTDRFGQRQELRSSMGTNLSLFSVGDKVQILYDQNDSDSAKINHWLTLYFFPFLIFFFAFDFLSMATVLFVVALFVI